MKAPSGRTAGTVVFGKGASLRRLFSSLVSLCFRLTWSWFAVLVAFLSACYNRFSSPAKVRKAIKRMKRRSSLPLVLHSILLHRFSQRWIGHNGILLVIDSALFHLQPRIFITFIRYWLGICSGLIKCLHFLPFSCRPTRRSAASASIKADELGSW